MNKKNIHLLIEPRSDERPVKRRPIKRLASNTVLLAFIATWFLVASPINLVEKPHRLEEGANYTTTGKFSVLSL
jgi:hypothetical protein